MYDLCVSDSSSMSLRYWRIKQTTDRVDITFGVVEYILCEQYTLHQTTNNFTLKSFFYYSCCYYSLWSSNPPQPHSKVYTGWFAFAFPVVVRVGICNLFRDPVVTGPTLHEGQREIFNIN